MIKNSKNVWWIAGSALIAFVFLLPFVLPDYRSFVERIIREYPALAPIVIIFVRFLAIVVAPLSGAPVAFASIALLPWQEAFLYNFLGGFAGGLVAFWIGRAFRERAVRKFAPLEQIHAWQDRIPVRKQFWAFVGLKLVSISAFDFVSYAAGLSRISFGTFLAATLIVDLPLTLAFFYLGGIAIRYSVILFIAFALILWIAAGGVFFRSYGSNREEKKSV